MGRKSDARERILESGMRLMHERGYASVGVEDIMADAGVGKSSFYHFFKSKEDLGEVVLGAYAQKMCREVLDKAFDGKISPLDRPVQFSSILAGQEGNVYGCMCGNSAAENSNLSERLREKTWEALEMLAGRFEDTYSEAVSEMELMPDAPVSDLAAASVAYFQGVMLLCRVRRSWEPMKTLGPLVTNIYQPYRV
jgi:TetR/AcrR family transcriptional repressor of nem operon